jgi:uncharacterized protein (DUF427 family)
MKIPGPDHPIVVEKCPRRIIVSLAGRTVADSRNALTLREASYRPVLYIPRQDADMSLFERSAHTTYCPYKGSASYFDLRLGGERSKNAVWCYETPFAAVGLIKDHLAFYPERVDAIEEL